MNPFILYDLLLPPLPLSLVVHGSMEMEFFFLLISQMGMLDHISIYIRIDRSTGRFTPSIFLQIVVVSTPMAMFYSEE